MRLLSREGPKLAVGDVNGDDKEDVFVAGARGQAGKLYLQKANGFELSVLNGFQAFADYEDTGVVFFDADNDDDLDLVCWCGRKCWSGRFQEFTRSAIYQRWEWHIRMRF